MLIFPTYQTLLTKTVTSSSVGSIITDDLVLHVDASDSSSYGGSGTTWTDLSGEGNHGTLRNSPTFNAASGSDPAYFNLPGGQTNDANVISVYFPSSLESDADDFHAASGKSFTIAVWFEALSSATNEFGAIVAKAGGWGGAGNIFLSYDGNDADLGARIRGVGSSSNIYNGDFPMGWHEIVLTWDGSTFKAYDNGSFVTNLTVGSAAVQNYRLSLGAAKSGENHGTDTPINIGELKVYSDALSASEVTSNYNALKSRYGLS